MEEFLKLKKEQSDDCRGWLEVLGNIFFAFFIIFAIAFALSFVDRVFEERQAAARSLGVPVWHSFLGIETAAAAPLKGYEVSQVSISGSSLTVAPGETKTVSVSFQNIGTSSWSNSGPNFVSIYTYEPKYRTSSFADPAWFAADQPVKLSESSVAVNKVGNISFKLKAPTKTGTYKETFALAAEDKAWIPGGQFTITINVAAANTDIKAPATPSAPSSPSTNTDGYSATILIKSIKKTIKAKGGETITFTAGFKNSGTKTWNSRSIKLPTVSIASSDYKNSSWVDSSTLVSKNDVSVAPGEMDLITFQFNAPNKKGSYAIKFSLAVDGVSSVPGGEIEIPVEVTSDAPEAQTSPKINSDEPTVSYIDEPTIRVGILIVDEETEDKVDVTCESDFDLIDGNGALLAEVEKNDEVEAFYKNGKYWFNRGKGLESTSFYLRFVPDTANAICTVTNFDRRVTRSSANADNQFRNVLELRYNEPNNRTWLINELPAEYYLRGLAETSNLSHLEFQKTLITAARTYAYYHFERATKHASEFFQVDAYADQVYNGYGQEVRTPRLTQAVQETVGYIVTYNNETAITPYFSRSDGRTRDWSEVWHGEVPWCVSVPTPSDVGKKLWGHGVGMSASAALSMANDGETWDEILKYFYTGIDLIKKWK
jgi:hypothetical protein